jgi:hypothetical protein
MRQIKLFREMFFLGKLADSHIDLVSDLWIDVENLDFFSRFIERNAGGGGL